MLPDRQSSTSMTSVGGMRQWSNSVPLRRACHLPYLFGRLLAWKAARSSVEASSAFLTLSPGLGRSRQMFAPRGFSPLTPMKVSIEYASRQQSVRQPSPSEAPSAHSAFPTPRLFSTSPLHLLWRQAFKIAIGQRAAGYRYIRHSPATALSDTTSMSSSTGKRVSLRPRIAAALMARPGFPFTRIHLASGI